MSTSPEPKSPTNTRNFGKNNLFNFKASAIKPKGTLYSDANSEPTKKPANNVKPGFSFLKLDSPLKTNEIFPSVADTVNTDPNQNASEVTEKNSPQTATEPKAPVEDKPEETKDPIGSKLYVFGQKIEARVIIHESEASESSSQDVRPNLPETSKPLCEPPPVQKVITGEEGESVRVEISCKLFIFDSSNKTWHSKGRNTLHLNESSDEEHKSRIICRSHGNQLVLLNSPIWSEMLCELSNQNSIKLSANLQEEGIRVVLIQGEKRDIAILYSALQTGIANCSLYKDSTVSSTSPQDTVDTGQHSSDAPDPHYPGTSPPQEATATPSHNKLPISRKRSNEEPDGSEDKFPPPDSTWKLGEDGTENSRKRSKISDFVNQ